MAVYEYRPGVQPGKDWYVSSTGHFHSSREAAEHDAQMEQMRRTKPADSALEELSTEEVRPGTRGDGQRGHSRLCFPQAAEKGNEMAGSLATALNTPDEATSTPDKAAAFDRIASQGWGTSRQTAAPVTITPDKPATIDLSDLGGKQVTPSKQPPTIDLSDLGGKPVTITPDKLAAFDRIAASGVTITPDAGTTPTQFSFPAAGPGGGIYTATMPKNKADQLNEEGRQARK